MKRYTALVCALAVLVLATVLVVGGCSKSAPATGAVVTGISIRGSGVYRFTDLNGTVTCWVYGYRGGMSCIPTKDIGHSPLK